MSSFSFALLLLVTIAISNINGQGSDECCDQKSCDQSIFALLAQSITIIKQ